MDYYVGGTLTGIMGTHYGSHKGVEVIGHNPMLKGDGGGVFGVMPARQALRRTRSDVSAIMIDQSFRYINLRDELFPLLPVSSITN